MLKIQDPAQRLDLARVMEELSGFATLISRVTVMECELSAMLDPAAKRPSPLNRVPLVGRGVRHAFGLSSGIAIVDESGRDASEELRAKIGEADFDRKMEEIFVESERTVLRGPADSNEDRALRSLGYFPEGPRGIVEDRAAQNAPSRQFWTPTPIGAAAGYAISSRPANSRSSSRTFFPAPSKSGVSLSGR
jgi:hypothetical protein